MAVLKGFLSFRQEQHFDLTNRPNSFHWVKPGQLQHLNCRHAKVLHAENENCHLLFGSNSGHELFSYEFQNFVKIQNESENVAENGNHPDADFFRALRR